MKTSTMKNIAFALALGLCTLGTWAQTTSESTGVQRRGPGNGPRGQQQQPAAPGVTPRLQNHYDDQGTSLTDADRQWMRIIYRDIDLDQDKNAPLYYPEEIVDGQENLFRIIMRLLANNQLNAYEYLDGREVFTEQYQLKVRDLLDRFHIVYKPGKGSTERNPRFEIDEADVPTNEVLSYYIIERWEFDTRHNRMKTIVEAICPVLHRSGDFGGEAVKYPMFWIKYADLRPWLASQTIFVSDDNNIPTCTYDDFFTLNLYQGDIYKTRNLKNRSMQQIYTDPDALRQAQDSIQAQLTGFEDKLWVPDREEIIGGGKKPQASTGKNQGAEQTAPGDSTSVDGDTATAPAPKTTRRQTRRSSKTKVSKPKQPKTNTPSSATRSVRRRK